MAPVASARARPSPREPFEARLATPPAGAAAQPRSRGLYLGTSSYEVVDRLQAPVVSARQQERPQGHRALDDRREVPPRPARAVRQPHAADAASRADGTFGRSERFAVRYADALVRYRTRFAGRFAGEGASGTLRLRARVFNRSGKQLRTRCDSGTRTWNAAFAGRHADADDRPVGPAAARHTGSRGSRSSAPGRCG